MKNTASTASIKTDIFEFCQAYAGILKPFVASLRAVRANIHGKGDAETLQRPMAGFSDVHHRMESLLNKVEEQQAYLIIFGPLKSGKSTLMNAISAAYVSEVTSLPAYPCLVHVKHGDECSFVASRYSGEKVRFADNGALQALIEQSHETLAERLRQVEDQGDTFDPGVHYPDAIRRVDVTVPARNLKDSLTVLVDTPGLYTRMKFGYDLMTREFRNSAACAVFVVKTDNLFLEQVFEEFNELLDLFSRIFIVVNIDTNKRDLAADGSLQPSLESKSPGEVIRAFESLVMSAPLRRAQEAGRLKIYPIDLLNSASAAMRRAIEPPQPAAVNDEPATPDTTVDASPAEEVVAAAPDAAAAENNPEVAPATPAEPTLLPYVPDALSALSPLPALGVPHVVGEPSAPAAEEPGSAAGDGMTGVMPVGSGDHPEASFAIFLKDLTDYLNSSDYLHEFMGDALLMGTNLGAEIQEHCSEKSTAALETRQQALEADFRTTEARLAAMGQLAATDIMEAFLHLRGELQNHVVEVSNAAASEARQKALKQLDGWFDSDQSVADLQNDWTALLAACGKRVSAECHLKARALVSSPLGGIRIDESLRASALGLAELLDPVVAMARSSLGDTAPALVSDAFRIEPENLKVRKSWWDWLAFRSLATVRRRLFGPPDEMDLEVAIPIKEKQLGEAGRLALEERILGELARQFPKEAQHVSDAMMTRYIELYGKGLHDTVRLGRDKDAAHLAALKQRIDDNRTILRTLAALTREADGMLGEIAALGRKYRSYSRVTTAIGEADDMPAGDAEAALASLDEAPAQATPADEAGVFEPVAHPLEDLPEDCGCREVEDESGGGRCA